MKEVAQAGYVALKGADDVKSSIDICKRQKIYIPQNSVNLIREIGNYHRKKNPNAMGESDKFLDEPVKYNDHSVDSGRYGTVGLTSRFGLATARPVSLEPIKALSFGKDQNDNNKILNKWMKK